MRNICQPLIIHRCIIFGIVYILSFSCIFIISGGSLVNGFIQHHFLRQTARAHGIIIPCPEIYQLSSRTSLGTGGCRVLTSTTRRNLNEYKNDVDDKRKSNLVNDIAAANLERRGRRGENQNVRAVMSLLIDHYGCCGGGSSEWKKTRNYLYKAYATNRRGLSLTLKKVERVIQFLQEIFPNDIGLQKLILQTSPRILSKSVTTNLRPTAKFLQQLYGPKLFEEAVRRNPSLLLVSNIGYNDQSELHLVDLFLTQETKLSPREIDKLKSTTPSIFQLSMVQVLSCVNYLKSVLRQSSSTRYSETNISYRIGKLIMSHPQILQLSVEDNIKPSLQFLQERCDLEDSDLADLLQSACGGIFGLSTKDNLKPKLDLLSNVLHPLGRKSLRNIVLSHPPLLGLSLQNIQRKIAYFHAIDSMDYSYVATTNSSRRNYEESLQRKRFNTKQPRLSLASRILLRSPAVFSLSLIDNIIPTITYLANIWGTPAPPSLEWDGNEFEATTNCSNERKNYNQDNRPRDRNNSDVQDSKQLSALLREYPSVLTLSLEGNILPTVNFFNRTGYLSLSSNKGSSSPPLLRGRYIAASLFNRLLPRWHYVMTLMSTKKQKKLEEQHQQQLSLVSSSPASTIPNDASSQNLQDMIPLHVLVSTTDAAFCEYYDIEFKDFCRFKVEAIPRLKFRSQFDVWLTTGRPIDV